ncbi:hypothetical protein ACUXVY_08790 [Chromobacterium haemolyticum]|uniref:hypothetical protein n=1 Tax=Chromobacterium haemolyticum TaxID=394935 RepID=UPI0040576C1A
MGNLLLEVRENQRLPRQTQRKFGKRAENSTSPAVDGFSRPSAGMKRHGGIVVHKGGDGQFIAQKNSSLQKTITAYFYSHKKMT